ncbi:MAG: PhnD/SsuA/transferrin family substrate-binding protein, partial [Planctomycetales bacterium]|nr:PhnD/SsuA/transferrin family substrate-binding protein [Planctomycetales bacterium]
MIALHRFWTIVVIGLYCAALPQAPAAETTAKSITMVVMDPLAKPLSCPCVQGYAQRDYQQLADALSERLGCQVKWVANESLTAAMKKQTGGQADLVIGKYSVIMFDAKRANVDLRPVATLTGKDGTTTMTGLVVVPTADPAESVADLSGVRLVFGTQECDEKHAAAITLLKKHGIQVPDDLETSQACSEGAISILEEAAQGQRGAAVISSYARPLLEG